MIETVSQVGAGDNSYIHSELPDRNYTSTIFFMLDKHLRQTSGGRWTLTI